MAADATSLIELHSCCRTRFWRAASANGTSLRCSHTALTRCAVRVLRLGCIVRCRGFAQADALTSHCRFTSEIVFPHALQHYSLVCSVLLQTVPLLARRAVRRASQHGAVIFVFMSSCLVVMLKILSYQASPASVTTAATRFYTRASDGARTLRVFA